MMGRDWTVLLWREKTWSERAKTVVSFSIASVVGLGMLLGIMMVLSKMIDVADERREDHDRCMKRATNGYEIEKCR